MVFNFIPVFLARFVCLLALFGLDENILSASWNKAAMCSFALLSMDLLRRMTDMIEVEYINVDEKLFIVNWFLLMYV